MDAREREARSVQRKLAVWSLGFMAVSAWLSEPDFLVMASVFVAACAVIDAMRAFHRDDPA